MVDALVKNGLISQNGGCWELTVDLDEVAVEAPENVVGLIEREHDRLAPLERSVLEAASVAGLDFSTAAVAAAVQENLVRVEEVTAQSTGS
jgi:predicted ATPase